MPRSRRHEIGVGLLLIAALALLGWMSLQVGALAGFGDTLTVRARLPDAAGLTEGAAVKIAGVEVGRVRSLRVEGGVAVAELAIARDAGVGEDVAAQVRARSVLGEKYLALIPGSPDAPPLADGATITRVRGQTEIDELVNMLGALLRGVDPEEVNRGLAALNRALEEDPERLGHMLDDLSVILDHAAEASAELPALARQSREAASRVARLADRAGPTLDHADAVLDRLDAATADLPETAGEVRQLVGETRDTVEELRGTLGDARRVVRRIDAHGAEIDAILDNLSEIDKEELRRLLREEGILVRLRPSRDGG